MKRFLLYASLAVLLLSFFLSIPTVHAANVGLSATGVDPKTVPVGPLGGKFKVTYNILNNEGFHISAYLGLSIRPSDCLSCEYFDQSNDLGSRVTILPGSSMHERFFEIRPGVGTFPTIIQPGSYDVVWSIWDGPPNGPSSNRLDHTGWKSNFMNIEWISLPSFELDPSTVLPGSSLTAVYTIRNQGIDGSLSTIHDVSLWLDLVIRHSDTDEVISYPLGDEKVEAHIGSANFSRSFQVPNSTSSGWYDVAWSVWNGKPDRAVSMKIITSDPVWLPQKLFVQSLVPAVAVPPAPAPTVESISREPSPAAPSFPDLTEVLVDETRGTPSSASEISKKPTIIITPTVTPSSVPFALDLPSYAEIIRDLEDIVPNLDGPIVYGILIALAFVFLGSFLALYVRSKHRRLIED